MSFSLNEKWKVNHFPDDYDVAAILQDDFVPEGWLTAQIPEDIHATLRRAGVIRGNTYQKQEAEEAWIEQKTWVYYKEFFAPQTLQANRLSLTFEGLDTFCDVYLNGVKLGSHQNMHTPRSFEVASVLRYGARNVLVVRFHSPIAAVEQLDQSQIFSITNSDRIFARKAQMNYSWDFCGRCITVGIWKPAYLTAHDLPEIESYYLYTKEIRDGAASIGLEAKVAYPPQEAQDCMLTVSLSNAGKIVYQYTAAPEAFESFAFEMENPSLWWPRPYGAPELYDFTLTLHRGETVLDQRKQAFGVRTIAVLEEPQADGLSFQFAVNGKRLFIRGANWVPINTVYTDITRRDYEVLVHYAVQGNLSMLRIWGGGIYEDPALFELCDQQGILLWNDFMLSCGIYPQTDDFLQAMDLEAEYVLKAYRNYTCLAIWAGDNENGQAYGWAGRPYEFEQDQISNVVLKQACQRLDPHRYYLATSPGSPHPAIRGGDEPSSPHQGDVHLYIMSADPGETANRNYGKEYYKRVTGYRPRFMSEFGFTSLPEKDSFYRFNFLREPLRAPKELIRFLPMIKGYLDAGQMDEAIYYSQVFNGMALKYWIEHFRSLKGICSGLLYWKFNDPLADSPDEYMYPSHMCTVDMYLSPKMTYYYTRRAYEDVLVLFAEKLEGLQIYACNETDTDLPGELWLTHMCFDGTVLRRIKCPAEGKQDSATLLYLLPKDELAVQDRFSEYLKAELHVNGQCYENRYFFADIYEIDRLTLTEAALSITAAKCADRSITFTLHADRYARNVRLNILDVRADYSDSYFEMDAGTHKDIRIDVLDAENLKDTVLYVEGENVPRMVLPLAAPETW